jgi:hypothetical protein
MAPSQIQRMMIDDGRELRRDSDIGVAPSDGRRGENRREFSRAENEPIEIVGS